MRVSYVGASKKQWGDSMKRRGAELTYEHEELPFVRAVAAAMEQDGWDVMIDYEWGFCELESREDYNDFMADWKAAKKTAKKSRNTYRLNKELS